MTPEFAAYMMYAEWLLRVNSLKKKKSLQEKMLVKKQVKKQVEKLL